MQPTSPIEPEGTFDGLRPGAILLGAFVDVGATIALSTLLLAWLAPEVFGASEAEARDAVEALATSTGFAVGNLLLGAACTVLGAFVGARRAGRLHVRHGGWVAVTSAALGALLLLGSPGTAPESSVPFWIEAAGWLLILPAGLLGGALARAADGEP